MRSRKKARKSIADRNRQEKKDKKKNKNAYDPDDNWARVELWRWQYGDLPQSGDTRPLDVSKGLMGLARAIKENDKDNFPTPLNVVAILEYCSRRLR